MLETEWYNGQNQGCKIGLVKRVKTIGVIVWHLG